MKISNLNKTEQFECHDTTNIIQMNVTNSIYFRKFGHENRKFLLIDRSSSLKILLDLFSSKEKEMIDDIKQIQLLKNM